MSWEINETIENYKFRFGKGTIFLNADKTMNYQAISYPVRWTGFIENEVVAIIQKSHSAISLNDFEFEIFPEKYSFAKEKVIFWIHDYLRILN